MRALLTRLSMLVLILTGAATPSRAEVGEVTLA